VAPLNNSQKQEEMGKRSLWVILWLFLLGCSSVRVQSPEVASGFALADYKTFGFYQISANGEAADQPYQHQINLLQSAIQQQLTAKGLTYAPADPDLLVNIGVVTREKVQTRQTDFRTDAPRYIGQRRYSWRSEEVEVRRYQEGTVTVDLVDRKKDALVWKGTAAAVIPRKEARLQKTIAAGVTKLFEPL
jgi:Domain of unknown function (DUF4136)